MKYLILFFMFQASAFAKVGFVPAAKDKPTPQSLCKAKVEKLIHVTAKQMGFSGEFGLSLTDEAAGNDIQDRPLTRYRSSVFLVDEGYLSNSGAEVTVRNTATGCDVIKLSVSVGG